MDHLSELLAILPSGASLHLPQSTSERLEIEAYIKSGRTEEDGIICFKPGQQARDEWVFVRLKEPT